MNYKQTLKKVTKKVEKFKLNDINSLNELNSFIIEEKAIYMLAKEETIEYYTFIALQNMHIFLEKSIQDYLENAKIKDKIEKEIKIYCLMLVKFF